MKSNSWKYHKEVKEYMAEAGVISPEKLLENIILKTPENRYKAFFCLMYLTGARISEIINLKRENLELTQKAGRHVFIVRLPNRKHKKVKHKEIMIPLDVDIERRFVGEVMRYAQNFYQDEELFEFCMNSAYKYCMRKYNMNPHILRGIRATHLAVNYGFNEQELVRFMGWTDSRPARFYVTLRSTDFLKFFKPDVEFIEEEKK